MLEQSPKDVRVQILRGAKADPELALAAKHFKCGACSVSREGAPVARSLLTRVDLMMMKETDIGGYPFCVVMERVTARLFTLVVHVADDGGQPASSKFLGKFSRRWASRLGWLTTGPMLGSCAIRNQGAFSKGLQDRGVQIPAARLESPGHIGRGERHEGMSRELGDAHVANYLDGQNFNGFL